EDFRSSVARYCHVRWISRGEDQAHDSGVRGGQAGGRAMRLRYGSWPPIGVPEGAMVPLLRTCLHAVRRSTRKRAQAAKARAATSSCGTPAETAYVIAACVRHRGPAALSRNSLVGTQCKGCVFRRALLPTLMKSSNEQRNVRFWHKADITRLSFNVRF